MIVLPYGAIRYAIAPYRLRLTVLHVFATRLHEIVKERRSITSDTALRLVRYFGGDAQSWLSLQTAYDLRVAEQQALSTIEPREAA